MTVEQGNVPDHITPDTPIRGILLHTRRKAKLIPKDGTSYFGNKLPPEAVVQLRNHLAAEIRRLRNLPPNMTLEESWRAQEQHFVSEDAIRDIVISQRTGSILDEE